MPAPLVVFVHGWSVRNTETYGGLPARLVARGRARGRRLDVHHVFLGKYVSFRDEVRVEDLARAFDAALSREPVIRAALRARRRLAVITHSTGGPVVRAWWRRYHGGTRARCPVSHLVMLAPANFGSALAQLGKSTIGRLKSWFEGVEPGQGVLDWLELGSPEAWDLNTSWIRQAPRWWSRSPVYSFVLTGQTIDRSLYDHVNSYTDETGSDGVVRVASANLNATYLRLVQRPAAPAGAGDWRQTTLVPDVDATAPLTPLAVLPGLAHAGAERGIMRSVPAETTGGAHPTVDAILRCLAVSSRAAYVKLAREFDALTATTQAGERVEKQKTLFLFRRTFEHPLTSQIIVRLTDDHGHPIREFDFLLTAWDPAARDPRHRAPSPDLLPEGFFIDRQRNRRHPGTLTYYLNYEALRQSAGLGVRILPRPEPDPAGGARDYFVHYLRAEFGGGTTSLAPYVKPNRTLLLDIVLARVVREGAFRLRPLDEMTGPEDFTHDPPGPPIDD